VVNLALKGELCPLDSPHRSSPGVNTLQCLEEQGLLPWGITYVTPRGQLHPFRPTSLPFTFAPMGEVKNWPLEPKATPRGQLQPEGELLNES
jgi:hypothetical protein